MPGCKFRFHLFDEAPESTHPDAFDKICERTSVLSILSEPFGEKNSRLIIATTPEALRSPCPMLEHNLDAEIKVITGKEIDFCQFPVRLAENLGYSSEILCEEPGQFAVRGGIIDVYPVNATTPYRIDFLVMKWRKSKLLIPLHKEREEKIDFIRISSSVDEEKNAMEGAFFSYIQSPSTWVFQEPELLITQFPLLSRVRGKQP